MGASRGGTSGRRRALRGPKAAAVTATAMGLAAPEEMTTAGFFLEERGGGGLGRSKGIIIQRVNRIRTWV